MLVHRLKLLLDIGWGVGSAKGWESSGSLLQYPLAELVHLPFWQEPRPVLELTLLVKKRHAWVSLFSSVAAVDVQAHVLARLATLEQIAAPDHAALEKLPARLWEATGGWGDAVNWEARASALVERTQAWLEVLEALREQSLQVAAEVAEMFGVAPPRA
jgi:hypothetical protein